MAHHIVTRTIFRTPLEWHAAKELVYRGKARVVDSVRHWTWEWMAIEFDEDTRKVMQKGVPLKINV